MLDAPFYAKGKTEEDLMYQIGKPDARVRWPSGQRKPTNQKSLTEWYRTAACLPNPQSDNAP